MKLFYYDSKHERVNGELDLDKLKDSEKDLVIKIINFCKDSGLTDGRYRNLVLAESYEKKVEDDFPFIEFFDEEDLTDR